MRPRRTFEDGVGGRPACSAGFALLDVMMALMILALVAAVAMPGVRRPAGPLALRTAAYQISAMLRDARTTAIGTGRPVDARVEFGEMGMRVIAGGFAVEMPPGTSVGLLGGRKGLLSFEPDGTSSGGTFLLKRDGTGLSVAVSADTGAIDVAGL